MNDFVKSNFSRNSVSYDRYAIIQKKTAADLIFHISENGKFKKILDIGSGTGILTEMLLDKFPDSDIDAVDFSQTMIDAAKKKSRLSSVDFKCMDISSLNINSVYDLLISNAAFQWVENIQPLLKKCRDMLNRDGYLLFSTFGPGTYSELRDVLSSYFKKDISLASSYFRNGRSWEEDMGNLFKNFNISEKTYKLTFNDLRELLNVIKYTGTRGRGVSEKIFWTRQVIRDIEKIYLDKFSSIDVSYQVYFVLCR